MPTQPVQNLKGFRDLLPAEKKQRDYVSNKMKAVFERYGFVPLETPSLEYASLLLGKYGDEADKLVYSFADRGDRQVALRYDQTVPTARVLAQYQNELPKFFRRYQIQNVFRADKPQQGRYREFTQADCDIFGSTSPLADAELLAVFYAAYRELGLESLIIEINDRQTLQNVLQPFCTGETTFSSLCQIIDKKNKLSEATFRAELGLKNLSETAIDELLGKLNSAVMSSNLANIVDKAIQLGMPEKAIKFNPNLARGLDYYTGLIFEGIIPEYAGGSIGGGGRYDQLIEQLAGVAMPAVGFGIGFDRTVEAVQQTGKLPENLAATKVLVTVFSEELANQSLQAANQFRQAGIATEVYPAIDKIGKQFKLANQKQIPYVVIIGENEAANNQVTLKNMNSGEQKTLTIDSTITELQT